MTKPLDWLTVRPKCLYAICMNSTSLIVEEVANPRFVYFKIEQNTFQRGFSDFELKSFELRGQNSQYEKDNI